jgi:hypothetical protein
MGRISSLTPMQCPTDSTRLCARPSPPSLPLPLCPLPFAFQPASLFARDRKSR